MPKVTLTFELPEEDMEFREAIDGWRWHSVISEFRKWLRGQNKYAADKPDLYQIYDRLHEIVNEEVLEI